MKCQNCGAENEESFLFCKSCGEKLGSAKRATAGAKSSGGISGGASASRLLGGGKRGMLALIAACVAIAAIVVVAGVATSGTREQDDAARRAIENSSRISSGFVSDDYIGRSDYALTAFRVVNRRGVEAKEERILSIAYAADEFAAVECEGTVENASVSTDFDAIVYVCRKNGHWSALEDEVAFADEASRALKGIDYLTEDGDSTYSGVRSYTEGLRQDFDEGAQTTTATGNAVSEYWFGAETTEMTQRFHFDPSTGWEAEGGPDAGSPQMNWTLEGKSFRAEDYARNLDTQPDSTLSFEEVSGRTVTASYTLSEPSDEFSKGISLKGKLKGKLVHKEGDNGFSVRLVDTKDKSIVFDCSTYFSNTYLEDEELTLYEIDAAVTTDKVIDDFGDTYSVRATYFMTAPGYESVFGDSEGAA